jgi:hypothetical protein
MENARVGARYLNSKPVRAYLNCARQNPPNRTATEGLSWSEI